MILKKYPKLYTKLVRNKAHFKSHSTPDGCKVQRNRASTWQWQEDHGDKWDSAWCQRALQMDSAAPSPHSSEGLIHDRWQKQTSNEAPDNGLMPQSHPRLRKGWMAHKIIWHIGHSHNVVMWKKTNVKALAIFPPSGKQTGIDIYACSGFTWWIIDALPCGFIQKWLWNSNLQYFLIFLRIRSC